VHQVDLFTKITLWCTVNHT